MNLSQPCQAKRAGLVTMVQRGILCGVALNLALIGYGLFLFPAALSEGRDGLKGLAGDILILTTYAVLGWIGAEQTFKANPATLRIGTKVGLGVALVYFFVVESEYLVRFDSRTGPVLGKAMVLAVFSLFFLAGILAAFKSGRIRFGILAAMWSAGIGTLIWFSLVLLTYYLFLGTEQQHHVLELENHDDFVRSGMRDFRAFIMQDFMGACFYHLLISPLFGAVWGAVGGIIGVAYRRFNPRQGS